MATAPAISVIVPVYNTAKYLPECIESILGQTFTDFELIIIDDHSTDSSPAICSRYAAKDSRVSIHVNPGKGVASARNFGITQARGQYVVFVDSDDYVDPDYLADLLRQPLPEGMGMVSQSLYCEHPTYTHMLFDYRKDITATENIGEIIGPENLLTNGCPVSKLFNRELILSKGIVFPEDLSYHEDHVFVLDYITHCDFIVLSSRHPYHYVCRDAHSLSKQKLTGTTLSKTSKLLIQGIERCHKSFDIDDEYLAKAYSSIGMYGMLNAIIFARLGSYMQITRDFRQVSHLFPGYFQPYRPKHPRVINNLCNSPSFLLPLFLFYFNIKRLLKPKRVW